MSYPAANSNLAWRWMGLCPPESGYDHRVDEKYHKFKQCFGFHYGIGDFDYWNRTEVSKLSGEEKLELLKILIQDNKDEIGTRKYTGLNADGTINSSIDEFSDGRTDFFEKLTLEECRKQEWPHNHRSRYSTGYHCEDCGNFISKGSEEYFRTEEVSHYGMFIHNIRVMFLRNNTEVPQDVIDLKMQFDAIDKQNPYDVPLDEIQSLVDNCVQIHEKHKLFC